MDLRNGAITVGELLAYPPAKDLLLREFPAMAHHPMVHMAGRIPLTTAVQWAGDALPMQRQKEMWAKLEKL